MGWMKIAVAGVATLLSTVVCAVSVSGVTPLGPTDRLDGFTKTSDDRSLLDGTHGLRHLAQQISTGSKVALLIANATYPDDDKRLGQPGMDARALAEQLRRDGFDLVVAEDLTKQKMQSAIEGFTAKIKPGATALLFFSGYGIQTQATKQSYLIPVDAQIWTEGDVKRDGISIESILSEMPAAGASVKVLIIDAARRNPFERRFRGYSAGLAFLNATSGTLAIYSTAPNKTVSETSGERSLFVTELLKEMRSLGVTAEDIFNRTRIRVSEASKNEQVPSVFSSLTVNFYFVEPATQPRLSARSDGSLHDVLLARMAAYSISTRRSMIR
jgi:uncharacterized caspase-like protein